MKEYGLAPQHIITVPILVGTDGVEKMGKSTGKTIAVTAPPDEMFGAIMSLPDSIRVFSQRKTPSEMPSFVLSQPMTIVELLADAGLARSMSKARRLVQQGGVRLDGQRVRDIHARVALPMGSDELTLRVGRRRFLRLIKPDDKENNTNDARADATD
jgi:tyrosyl-tRNA synthetase